MKGQLRVLPEEIIRLSLMPTSEASVTAKGVKFKKMFYVSEELLRGNWFSRARTNGSWKVRITFDPRDLTHVYLVDDGKFNYQKLTLVDYLSKFKNRDISEIGHIVDYEKSMIKKSKDKELNAKVKLFSEIENIVETARSETISAVDPTQSNAQRLKGIKDNLRIEKQKQRNLLKDKQLEEANQFNDDNNLSNVNVDELSLFKEIQKKSWDDLDE